MSRLSRTVTAVAVLILATTLNLRGHQSTSSLAGPDLVRVRKVLELSGAGNLGKMMVDQMIPPMRQAMPDVPAEFWDEFEKEVKTDELVELIVPIYAKHFSADEIEQLIAFYESPIGKKLIAQQPAIMQESMQVGQQWGQELGMKVSRKLQERGIQPR